ncbi:Hypothetical predicted protein [Mytilus galloprovincialis]|uniref:Uncharacterized protein n=1 Tax=Mytilus galloprovincialis TaxID=29158 RepID=A0A8B6DYB5_MYTGA|nr:Hypothetical predicted protein [Mytilus galloprovincialis]
MQLFINNLALAFNRSLTSVSADTDLQQGDQCPKWEVYDGVDCVCADDRTARCSDEGGMVCDNKGKQYKSPCYFSLKICQQKIGPDTNIVSCGGCKMLRLTGGKDFPSDTTLAKFERIGDDTGLTTKYRSLAGDDIQVFYSSELGAWAIGKTNETGNSVAMVQMLNGSYPEEGNPGMLIPRQTGTSITWESDLTYRLECITEEEHGLRQKRFIFTLIFTITVVTAVTTTTLKVVQATKGCLYYPKVCKMRDEIKKHLLPEVTRKRNSFLSKYGKSSQIEAAASKIHDQVTDIKDKILIIKELDTAIDKNLIDLVNLYSSIKDDFSYINADILSDYNEWVKNTISAAALQVNLLPIEILMTLPVLVATSATTLALAASGIGAVLAVGFAIVDVVSSVKEEARVRDQLQEKKNTLIKSRNQLNSAFRSMKTFQKKFCQYVVKFLYDLSSKGKQYEPKLLSLYKFVSKTYGHSKYRCYYNHIIEKSNRNTLERLSNNYLQPIITVLSNSIDKLKLKIQEIKEANVFLEEIKNKILKKSEKPSDIFKFIKMYKPKLTKQMYSNLFDLLKFISKSVLPNRNCYWGHDLNLIRKGVTTVHNYIKSSICDSQEIEYLTNEIRNGVKTNIPVCRIARQVTGTIFRSRFTVIRYIADHILPNKDCYWGYDLSSIRGTSDEVRGTPDVNEINNAKIDAAFITTMKNLKTSNVPMSLIKPILKGQFGILTSKWQTFILYHIWHNKYMSNDTCPEAPCSSTCFPSTTQFDTC